MIAVRRIILMLVVLLCWSVETVCASPVLEGEVAGMEIDATSLPGFSVYTPKAFPGNGGCLPVFVFGNGACSHNSADYLPMFAELVGNGYVVIAIGTADGKSTLAPESGEDNLLDAVDWICRQDVTPGSRFHRRIDRFHIAVGGHSCGGAQAIAASYDPRVTTTLVLNAGMGRMEMAGASAESLKDFHRPVLYLIGGKEDIAYDNAAIDYAAIDHVPVAHANFPVGHGGTYRQPGGGVFGKVVLMWLDWQLKGKKEASKFFLNKSWRKKHYPDCVFESKGF